MASASSSLSETDDLLPLSALQHWLFCPRQCALIHVERLWEENALTAEGRVLHERADGGKADTKGGVRLLRSLPLHSARLGIAGVADVVEMHGDQPLPVEYKRGRPKAHRADEVQVCAQALCLEEMMGCTIPEGHLFYGEPRRRTVVPLDADLRALTERIAAEARSAIAAGRVPPPVYEKRKCGACSLMEQCRPKQLEKPRAVATWLAARIEAS